MTSRRNFLRQLLGNFPSTAQTDDVSPNASSLHPQRETKPQSAAQEKEDENSMRYLVQAYGAAVGAVFGTDEGTQSDCDEQPAEPDYEAMLPPDFTAALLQMEADRLGLDIKKVGRNAIAKAILDAMGALPKPEMETVESEQEPIEQEPAEQESAKQDSVKQYPAEQESADITTESTKSLHQGRQSVFSEPIQDLLLPCGRSND